MAHILKLNEMSSKIGKDNLTKYGKDYKEVSLNELSKDYKFVVETINKILFGSINDKFVVLKSTRENKTYMMVAFTEKHEYTIRISPDYIGGGLNCRYEEPLEDWHRGNDLVDGKCTKETLLSVFADILYNELISVKQ